MASSDREKRDRSSRSPVPLAPAEDRWKEANPDPQCVGRPWKDAEKKSSYPCGLGAELLLALPLVWLWRRRAAVRAGSGCDPR